MEPMPLPLDAAFRRRVYANRQRVKDDRERVPGTNRRWPDDGGAVQGRVIPLSHATAMKSARAELATHARSIENLHGAIHP